MDYPVMRILQNIYKKVFSNANINEANGVDNGVVFCEKELKVDLNWVWKRVWSKVEKVWKVDIDECEMRVFWVNLTEELCSRSDEKRKYVEKDWTAPWDIVKWKK